MARKPQRTLRLVHTSDVHLESDTFGTGARGDEFRERVRRAFSGVIDLANQRESDLLLIVGDLFDSSRVPAEALRFAMSEIARARMPVRRRQPRGVSRRRWSTAARAARR